MIILPYELGSVVDDMHRARTVKLYYPCLLVALTLPEICSALLLPNERFVNQKHYVSFIDTYSSPGELGSDGVGIYRLRGGLVHRGNLAGHAHFGATHVVISVPESGSKLHAFSIEVGDKKAAMLDLDHFIDAMDAAVRRWYEANEANPLLKTNLPNLIRYSATGVAPFTKGLPAIVSGN